jgi:general secretion pathway protein G
MTRAQNGKNARRPHGFTLIELVIVIAVIAILAGLLVPTILGQAERARLTKAKSDTSELAKALARMRTDTASESAGCFVLANLQSTVAPADDSCGAALPDCRATTTAPGSRCWNGPYLPAGVTATDPWAQAYQIDYNTSTKSVTVTSGGPDTVIGGTNAGDDQTSTQ